MNPSSFVEPLIGGALIGLSAVLLLLFNGRIAGISGILAGVLLPQEADNAWRLSFVAGLVFGGMVLAIAMPEMFPPAPLRSAPTLAIAGLLVGVGTRLGSGCTSGHGVCGIGRFSVRGLVATVTFIATGALTVYAVNTYFGGAL